MAQTNHKTAAELRAMIARRASDTSGKGTNAHARLALLFDEGTFVEVGTYICKKKTVSDLASDEDFEPVVTGYGAVNGTLVYAFAQDCERSLGAFGEMHAKKIANIYDMAMRSAAPIVGVFDSAGAKILEGADALGGYGLIMSKAAQASGAIPQIAIIAGPCGGANAVMARMFDLIITSDGGSLYIAPRSVLEDKTLGSPEKLAEMGISSLSAKDEAQAFSLARKLIRYLGADAETDDDPNRIADISNVIASKNYDIHEVISQVFDVGSFLELKSAHAKHTVTGLAAINSRTVGIIANNPSVKDGKLCPCSCEKAAEFAELCSRLGLPLITLVDGDGVAMSDKAEQKDISKALARLARAYASAFVPRITVVLGRAYGAAYTVMGSKALGADVALALENASIAPMSPERAVEFLGEVTDESKAADVAAEWAEKFTSPLEAAKSGEIDDIIEASELRARIAAALEMLSV